MAVRTGQIRIGVSPKEKARFNEAAREMGLTTSSFARAAMALLANHLGVYRENQPQSGSQPKHAPRKATK